MAAANADELLAEWLRAVTAGGSGSPSRERYPGEHAQCGDGSCYWKAAFRVTAAGSAESRDSCSQHLSATIKAIIGTDVAPVAVWYIGG